jgi:hypothetical protein
VGVIGFQLRPKKSKGHEKDRKRSKKDRARKKKRKHKKITLSASSSF